MPSFYRWQRRRGKCEIKSQMVVFPSDGPEEPSEADSANALTPLEKTGIFGRTGAIVKVCQTKRTM